MMNSLNIKQEDSVVLEEISQHQSRLSTAKEKSSQKLLIQVIRLPRISNFTDFEPLACEHDVILEYINQPNRHCCPDLLIIPGTKSTVSDLEFIKNSGFADYIRRLSQRGSCILGICGGYQILGQRIDDPYNIESSQFSVEALGLLPIVTTFSSRKTTVQIKAIHLRSQLPIEGYEIHMGQTHSLNGISPFLKILKRQGKPSEDDDGHIAYLNSESGYPSFVMGTYIHGLFDLPDFRRYFLNEVRSLAGLVAVNVDNTHLVSSYAGNYNRLADEFEGNIDMQFLGEILGEPLV